ncbi:MAG TPA: OmpA family protein [Polyangia bacterium]|nr:OmpA family protein [Polyangia bacterium]
MSRPSLDLAGAVLIAACVGPFAGGCSHQQKVAQSAALATPQPAVAPAPRTATPVPPAPVVATTTKAGDAIFFDFDSALLRDDARAVLQKVASEARTKSREDLEVDGNCDELGTIEYNMALGDHRARAAKEYLVHLGVPSGRITTLSYGSQRPKFPGHDDDSRAKNRRDDLVMR